MKPELKKEWTAALRSGKYPQGHGRLRSSYGFCCLGVLCDVIDPNGWDVNSSDYTGSLQWKNLTATISGEWLEKVGMTVQNTNHCEYLNDSGEFSFEKIADHIDAMDMP